MVHQRNVAAFFDFHGTLFKGHLWQGLVKYFIRHRVKTFSAYSFLATHFTLSLFGELAAKIKILNPEAHKIKWGEDTAILLKGCSKEEASEIFEWITKDYFMELAQPDMSALLQHHLNEGHVTFVISGSYCDFLEVVRQKLGIDYAVGTELEVIDSVYSGNIIKPLCFGVNKARLLNEFIRRARLNINLSRSFAYADSIHDLAILDMVGNPVACYPDKHLLKVALQRNWQILLET
jgi:putative phosphoserine phosphatase/1-acylglycerol-3-phosphate O-acyltransferase